jgi:hypothetical protein
VPDLSHETTTNIASVLKLYLRQLPEPIIMSSIYDRMIAIGKVRV